MTSSPYERNSGHRGRRLRADEVRRARQSRAAPVSGRQVHVQKYQPRLSEEFPAVSEKKQRKGWTPFRLGLLAVSLSLLLLGAIVVVPVLVQMQRTAESVFQPPDEQIVIVDNPEGTPVIATPEASDDDENENEVEEIADDDEDLPDWDGDERINIALYGIDSREDGEPARSDTIIIVTIDPSTNEVGMLSIPRDLQVYIPDLGEEKINAAYSHGGRALTKAVIEYNFQIDIHYYAEVDFVGFINIVNTIGGVVVDNPAVIKDDEYEWTRVYFPTGPQHMDGETALSYVRTRYDDNDFARGQRQQQVLRALRQQGVRLNLVTRARSLLEDIEESFQTDLSMRQSLALARIANDIEADDITSYSILEGTTEDYVPDRYYYLVPDWDTIHEIVHEMIPPSEPEEVEEVDYSASIMIQNATFVDQFAGRTRDHLLEAGYANVEITQAENAGEQPVSEITVFGGNEQTAQDIANEIGLDSDAIIMDNGEHPGGYDIVVVLGDDAPEPDTS